MCSSDRFPVTICGLAIYLLSGSPVEFVLSVAYVLIPLLVIVLINYLKFRKNLLLSFFGDISYEIYLCQGVCFVLLRGHTIYIASDYVYAFMVYFVSDCSVSVFDVVISVTLLVFSISFFTSIGFA